MNEIAHLLSQAQRMGVRIYPQNGQVKMEMPWPPGSIPDYARHILGEIKKQRGELLAHFVLTNPPTDVRLYLEALRAWGVDLAPDKENGIRINVPPPGARNEEILVNLLDKPLKDYWYLALEYLAAHGHTEQPG